MSIAVVILNWNGLALLKTYLPSVVKYSKQAQIYVIDNASTDGSVDFLKHDYPTINCIKNSENTGYAGGYNRGLKSVKEDIHILLNNDVEVTKDWLLPLKNIFESQPHVAVVQPKILDASQRDYFEYAGAAGGFLDFFGYPYCRGRIFSTIEKDNGQYDQDIEILWASGACLAIRKDIFEKANGFDETYFAHQEEIDLCWRIFNQGYKILYSHKSCVYHLGGGTLETLDPKKTFLNFRNSLFNILKNTAFPLSLLIIFIRLIFDGLACFRFLFQWQWPHIFAILKAHFSFYANFFRILKKRESISKSFKRYYHSRSIVYQYFILKNKIFKKIG